MALNRSTRKPAWLTRNVFALGLVSLFTDVATEMSVPLLPAFVTGVLAAGPLALGWIEGAADAISALLKYLSGRWSDRTGKNKPFVLAGYGLASLVRPFLALAMTPLQVLGVRVTDRIGKGLRSSPRDVLLASSVDEQSRGAAFGFHRAMDHAGAVIGPLLALGVLALAPGNLRLVFALTAIPGALAVLAVLFLVRERRGERSGTEEMRREESSPAKSSASSRGDLLRFLVPLALFTLGNASDVFLLLKAGGEDTPLYGLPLLWMGLHIVKMLSVVPGGALADRWGRQRTIVLGWLVYAAVYFGFAFAQGRLPVILLFLVYGLYYGLTEGSEKALVAQITPGGRRGRSFGLYHMTLGLTALPASLLFGYLWESFGEMTAFLTSATLALLASLLLGVLTWGRKLKNG